MSRIYPCIYCTDDLHCTKYTDDNYESWCVLGPCQDETPSNADRIRSMTDEELVKQFAVEMGFCCPVKGVDCSLEPDCRVCFARWLKQEAKD